MWIESHTVLLRHRKLREFAAQLGVKPVHALGHLHALWHSALEQQEDGDLRSWSDAFIADAADFPVEQASAFIKAMQETRWLDGKLIHDWPDYAGNFLIRKYHTSNRQKLVEIWAKHGLNYGRFDGYGKHSSKRLGSDQEVDRKLKGNKKEAYLPNQPNQPNQPNLPTKAGAEAPDAWKNWPSQQGTGRNGQKAVRFNAPDGIGRAYEIEGLKPYLADTPVKRLVCEYKDVIGMEPWDRAWDAAEFPRCAKAAKKIIEDLGIQGALICLRQCAEYFEGEGLSWKLETVAKNTMDWKLGRLKKKEAKHV